MLNGIDSEFSPLKQFYTNFLKTFSNDDLEFFKSLTTDEERIQFVYDLPSLEGFEISKNKTLKSSDLAKKLKEDGNKAFQVDQFKVALALYSKAIIKQPQNSSSKLCCFCLCGSDFAYLYTTLKSYIIDFNSHYRIH